MLKYRQLNKGSVLMTIKSWAIIIISVIVVQIIVGQMFNFTVGRSKTVLSEESVTEVEEALDGSKVDQQLNILDRMVQGDKAND